MSSTAVSYYVHGQVTVSERRPKGTFLLSAIINAFHWLQGAEILNQIRKKTEE